MIGGRSRKILFIVFLLFNFSIYDAFCAGDIISELKVQSKQLAKKVKVEEVEFLGNWKLRMKYYSGVQKNFTLNPKGFLCIKEDPALNCSCIKSFDRLNLFKSTLKGNLEILLDGKSRIIKIILWEFPK